MTTNNTSTTLQHLIPTDRAYLMDHDTKVGTIEFTAEEKRELLKLTTSKGWAILEGVYAKQRAVAIAVAAVNVAQNENDLWYYKGKSSELDYMIKKIKEQAQSLRKEEDKHNKPQ